MINPPVAHLALATYCHNNGCMDWQRLGEYVTARRVQLKYRRREDLVEAVDGLSLRTLGDIESGRRTSYHKNTIATLENALDWAPGSVNQILDGGEPAQAAAPPPAIFKAEGSLTTAANVNPNTTDEALIRVMRSPDIDDATKAKIMRLLIAEQQRFERERIARVDELIEAFRADPPI